MLEKSSLIDEIGDMLLDSALFSGFAPAEVRSIARYFSISKVGGNGVVFHEGDAGTFMCIVSSGKVSILKANLEGENVEIATLIRDRTFGEMAVLDGERRSATCIAATDCTLLTLSRDSLDRMLDEVPRTAAKVIRAVAVALSRRLRMADGKLVDRRLGGAY
jgi:CRP/FNR family transcriptional regulator, cyclic AMP receptor protein